MVDMETLYFDAAALIERFDVAPCHFVGLSMGGFVGLRLAARRPDLLKSLVVADTRAGREPAENLPRYERLTTVAEWLGTRLVVDRVMPLMFSDRFLESDDPRIRDRRETWRERLAGRSKHVHKAVRGVLHRASVESELGEIDVPTLVIHGEEDRAVHVDEGRELADVIDGAELRTFPETGHLSSIERPEQFSEALAEFLEEL
jgi:pimeloyl-ACP methyl ester carboxylesterase